MSRNYRAIDADAHVIETPFTFDYIEEKDRRYTPLVVNQIAGAEQPDAGARVDLLGGSEAGAEADDSAGGRSGRSSVGSRLPRESYPRGAWKREKDWKTGSKESRL